MTEGSCFCGAIKFQVSEFHADIYKCHCSLCRKRFGGASSAAVLVAEDSFELITGSDSIARFQSPSGSRSAFCRTCGTIAPIHIASQKLYWIPAGLFDSDPGISLKRHIHVNSKAAWEILDHETEQLPEGLEI